MKYIFKSFYQSGGVDGEITFQAIIKIPIPKIPLASQQPFIHLVDTILTKKQNNEDTVAEEQQIDVMVYKLYELTYAEVQVVDLEFPLPQEAYDNYLIT